MSHNRPHHHHGNIPPVQTRGTIYAYPMMPHPGIPAQHIPGVYNTQPGINRMPVPQAMYYYAQQPQMSEEQMKMQLREHNYHIQQQRLRSFNAASSQKRVNPDDFIQSMFGKPSNVKNNVPTNIQTPAPQPEPVAIPIPIPQPVSVQQTVVEPVQQQLPVNNKKKLEDMLLECSDLMRPGKAHSFPKIAAKESKNSKRKSSTEIKSDETANETKTNNLGFPSWCFVETQIPDLYRRVQQIVTNENGIDTNLLYPILVSSGLNRDILGHIWSLVNQSTPGQLLQHELYAALTLVALAQNGYKFTGLDILQSLARPLVPYLKEVMMAVPQTAVETQEVTKKTAKITDTLDDSQEEFTEFLGFAPTVQTPTLGSSAVGNRLANYNVGLSPPAKEKGGHQEEAKPKPKKEKNEFADFHNATGDSLITSTDEDKYSIFRELDRERHTSESSDKTDDEFGDFLCGTEVKIEEPVAPTSMAFPDRPPLAKPVEISHQNTKGFKLKPVGEKSVDSFIQTSLTQFQITSKSVQEDDFEFGDFVSPNETTPDVISSNQLAIKDTGSAESQSVSSLDLGPVDAVVAGNDTASLHSLELKTTFQDDEFGDLQCNIESLSLSRPKEVISNSSSRTMLDDPYRFVNSNMQSDLERNAQEWERCLESCYQLIEGADCILNEITSESVCEEVINSDEGINYLKNIIEIYLITARLQHSIKISGSANDSLNKLLCNINTAWTNISSFISKSKLMPREENFHFVDTTPKLDVQVCGVCLLSINASNEPDIHSLEFSGRQYHTACANFWVNCVNSLLPALTPQQQLLY